jgi:hypothetical protein
MEEDKKFLEKREAIMEENLGLANGMLVHNDYIDYKNKRSTLASPKVLKYPRGG